MSNKKKQRPPPMLMNEEAMLSSPNGAHLISDGSPAINRHLPVANPNSPPATTRAQAERRQNAALVTRRMQVGMDAPGPAPGPTPGPTLGPAPGPTPFAASSIRPGALNPAAGPFRPFRYIQPAAGGFKPQQSIPSATYFPNTPALVHNPPAAGPAPAHHGGPGPFPPFGVPPFNQPIAYGPFHQNTGYYPLIPSPGYGPINQSPINQSFGCGPVSQETGQDDNIAVGPAVPPSHNAPPTAWLSYECQKRHFNPVFRVVQLENGRFRCDIILRGIVVESGGMTFDDIQNAKNHTAVKARKVVQKWKGVDSLLSAGPVEELQVLRMEGHEEDGDEKESQMGLGAAVDMTNPAQARAYVEGFRMGQLAALQGANCSSREIVATPRERGKKRRERSHTRSRSHSPKHSRGDRHRRRRSRSSGHRSNSRREKPLPRYDDGSRHNPTLPSTDRYRPDPPADPEKEDSYGRLKENDCSHEG